jgi:hypothetical protein
MTGENPSDAPSLTVTTPEGYVVDLGPLVHVARETRRNSLVASEQESETAPGSTLTAATVLGMRIAVSTLFGRQAEKDFAAALTFRADEANGSPQ